MNPSVISTDAACPEVDGSGAWGMEVWDGALGVCAGAAAAAVTLGLQRARGAPAAERDRGWAGGEMGRVAAVGVAVGAATYMAARRLLPRMDDAELLLAEAAMLSSVEARVEHVWTSLTTARAKWTVHALLVRAGADARRKAGSRGAASAGEPARATSGDERAASAAELPALGAGADGRRPKAVLIHGHSSGAAFFECLLDALAPSMDLYVLDLPGWGRSPCPSVLSASRSPDEVLSLHLELLEAWLSALLGDEVGDEGVVLVGHSFGGLLAANFAAMFPSWASHVVLMDPAGLFPAMTRDFWWTVGVRVSPPQVVARTTGRLGFAAFLGTYGAFTTEDPRYPSYYYQLAYATSRWGGADAAFGSFVRHSLLWDSTWWARPLLGVVLALPMPVSVIWGEQDEIFPAHHAPILQHLRPDVDVYVVHSGLHNPAHTDADAAACAILSALRVRGTLPPLSSAPSALEKVSSAPLSSSIVDTAARLLATSAYTLLRVRRLHGGAQWPLPVPLPSLPRPGSGGSDAAALRGPQLSPLPESSDGMLHLSGATMHHWTQSGFGRRREVRGVTALRDVGVVDARRGSEAERGLCHSCGARVVLHKSYWRCLCGAWSFSSRSRSVAASPTLSWLRALLGERGNEHVHARTPEQMEHDMLAFLDALYVRGDFAARSCPALQGRFLRVRSALPAGILVPSASSSAAALAAGAASAAGDAPPPALTAPEDRAAAGPLAAGARTSRDPRDPRDRGGDRGGDGDASSLSELSDNADASAGARSPPSLDTNIASTQVASSALDDVAVSASTSATLATRVLGALELHLHARGDLPAVPAPEQECRSAARPRRNSQGSDASLPLPRAARARPPPRHVGALHVLTSLS